MLVEVSLVGLMILCLLEEATGHGLMQSPPARNYMWRLGFDTERNYDDVGLNCGGFSNQWDINGGRCGTCGDPFQGPREHEAGGRFARYDRPISQCYNKGGKIDVKLRITAYHKGYFEFRLCAHNNKFTPVSQSCLNQRLLTISGTNYTRYDINFYKTEFYTFQLDVPKDVTCDQCVVQWLYNTGNSFGCDVNGCGIGFGPQEQFINCADIAILPDCTHFYAQTTTPSPNNQDKNTFVTHSNWKNTHQTHNHWSNYAQRTSTSNERKTTLWQPTDDDADEEMEYETEHETEMTTWQSRGLDCHAIGFFAVVPKMNLWCKLNCNAKIPFCPQTHCRCGDDDGEYFKKRVCFATGFWAQLAGFSDWCHRNCNHHPSFCPQEICQCF